MNQQKGTLYKYLVYMATVLCCLVSSNLEARNVGLFYNSEYLDIIDGDLFAEASNLLATLEYLGHNVVTFQQLNDIEHLEIDLVIIPELEKLSLLNNSGESQISYLQSYIENGGGVIIMGVVSGEESESNNAIDLMNVVLNAQISGGEPVLSGTCTKSINLLPGEYTESPDVIDNNNATVYLQNGFTEGVKIIYHNTDHLGDVAVAQFPLGAGSMVYFGWGWWNAFPVGTQDGGWLALLDETIEMLSANVTEFTIAGQVQNAGGDPIQGVVLSLDSGENTETLLSDENGQLLSEVSALEVYKINLDKNIGLEEAISSRDLRMLSRHLLGIETFKSPYQFIAADINGDGVLNVFDEILMKKILLHDLQGDEILAPNVNFISKAYFFSPNLSPIQQNWDTLQESTIDINNSTLDIIFIKLGDIDSSFK